MRFSCRSSNYNYTNDCKEMLIMVDKQEKQQKNCHYGDIIACYMETDEVRA